MLSWKNEFILPSKFVFGTKISLFQIKYLIDT